MQLIWNTVICLSNFFLISESLKESNFTIRSGKTIGVSQTLMKITEVDSLVKCAYVCGADSDCSYGVLKSDVRECWLYSAALMRLSESNTDAVIIKCRRKEDLRFNGNYFSVSNSDLATIDLNYIVFSVSTDNQENQVMLKFYDQNRQIFEVVFGNPNLKVSQAYFTTTSEWVSVTHGWQLLDFFPMTYWIKWSNNMIEVGSGKTVGVSRFLSLTRNTGIPNVDKLEVISLQATNWVFQRQDPCK